MNSHFCDKYGPRRISDIIDKEFVHHFTGWLKNFKNETNKCLLITGSHGSGKTCRVKTILGELNYEIRYLNLHTFKKIPEKKMQERLEYLYEVTSPYTSMGLLRKKPVIVIDELDTSSLVAMEKSQMINLIKLNDTYKICPIIFVFDTKHNKIINKLKKGTSELKMATPTTDNLFALLHVITNGEKIKIANINVADKIIEFAQNDYRRLCTILYDLSLEKQIITDKIATKYLDLQCKKCVSYDLFESSKLLLDGFVENKDEKTFVDDCLKLYDLEKINIPLILHQHYIDKIMSTKYPNHNMIKSLTSALSYGDVIDNYIYGEQRWDLVPVHGFYSCCLPSYLLRSIAKKSSISLDFPKDLNKTSIKRLNVKHIINADRLFNTMDSINYIYMGKIFASLLQNNKIDELKSLMKQYKMTYEDIDSIIKIDKNTEIKIAITTKQKKY